MYRRHRRGRGRVANLFFCNQGFRNPRRFGDSTNSAYLLGFNRSSMMKLATQEEAKAVTVVFWDIKKFPVPPGFDARRIRPCIKQFLANHGYSGPLTIFAVGLLTNVHADILGALSSSGINLYYTPFGPGSIHLLIYRWTRKNPPPANILGICGPKALNQPRIGFNFLNSFSFSSSWIDFILSESEALDDHTCSETDESPSWYCTLCPDITGKGFESFTSHLSSTRHLLERSYSLPVKGKLIMDKLAYEDKNPPTIVRKQPEKATPEEAVAVTLVFWDINLFPIPLGFDARRVSLCIKHFLETYGYSGPLHIYAVGILTDVPANIREALSSSGITLCENFHGFTDMSQLMSDVLSCYQPPANIMGICDPRSFPLPLVGHNTFRPFSYLSPLQDKFLWENSLLAGETTSKSVAHADIVGASTMGSKQPNVSV